MINWTVTHEEADYIFRALAARPFAEVVQLINKLQAQANKNPAEAGSEEPVELQ